MQLSMTKTVINYIIYHLFSALLFLINVSLLLGYSFMKYINKKNVPNCRLLSM
uniref:Uncharacterized protein n=1 Tax=Octopus bimaculoides TaxID=37653 RepID=A0A0L8HV02_OCTBM